MIKTIELNAVDDSLMKFISACDNLNYKNNNSLKAMKFDWCLESGGHWYGTYVDDLLVSVSGSHPFMDGMRVLFRGCQLYCIPGGLSKTHMNNWSWYYHIPLSIDKFTDTPLYITTNTDNDASGKMLKLNKLYFILEKKGFVTHVTNEEIFGVNQNVWKLNNQFYLDNRPK